MNIAILEDEPADAKILQLSLEPSGYNCRVFAKGQTLIDSLAGMDCKLLILDWELPDISGDKILKWIRENMGWDLPVIFITGHDSSEDIVAMLDAGADDYMTKPVNIEEMLARVKALTRRTITEKATQMDINIGPFFIDYSSRRITSDGKEISLTPKEFKLASYLLGDIGKISSRKELLKDIWGYGYGVQTRTIDIHISRIRNKLSLIPENGWRLTSIYNEGYRLDRVTEN
jgi:two-component system, OmpR family, response regulator RegX3